MSQDLPGPAEEEADAKRCVELNRHNLRRFRDEFQRSVALFEFLERPETHQAIGDFGRSLFYRIIAARDGALNIYHFDCSLEAVRKQLPTCPELARTTDAVKLRNAGKQFDSYFPHAHNVRHAIAHAGELRNTPDKINSNRLKKPVTGRGYNYGIAFGSVIGSLDERTYSVSNLGQMFSVTLDEESIRKLTHVISLVDDAFRIPAAQAKPPSEN